MDFGSALAIAEDTAEALDEAIALATAPLAAPPDLVIGFATPNHADNAELIAARLQAVTAPGGSSVAVVAEGVIGGTIEADEGSGLAVWAATLPGVTCRTSHLRVVRLEQGLAIEGWGSVDSLAGVVLLADPFTFPAAEFAARLGRSGVPVAGGFANSGGGPGAAVLIADGEIHRRGALAVGLGGDIEFRTVVSQGCRPIGAPGVVTAADGASIQEIGGRPALEFLQDIVDTLDPETRRLVGTGLHLGIAVDEYVEDFSRGDFLIRGVVGADPDRGTISVGDVVAVGRTVQFQVRDPAGASEDLRALLADEPEGGGVLIFSCNGRGRRFFGEPNHDASLVGEMLAPPAAAGFFAAGEIGPIGGENHVHGYTASIVELRPG